MSKMKRVARLAAAAILATGIFAGSAAPASAVVDDGAQSRVLVKDTGWGG